MLHLHTGIKFITAGSFCRLFVSQSQLSYNSCQTAVWNFLIVSFRQYFLNTNNILFAVVKMLPDQRLGGLVARGFFSPLSVPFNDTANRIARHLENAADVPDLAPCLV